MKAEGLEGSDFSDAGLYLSGTFAYGCIMHIPVAKHRFNV
jgi:hypothetical protein